jgi:hypothetical protein
LAVHDEIVDTVGVGFIVCVRALSAEAFPANIASAVQTASPVSNDFVMILSSFVVQPHSC